MRRDRRADVRFQAKLDQHKARVDEAIARMTDTGDKLFTEFVTGNHRDLTTPMGLLHELATIALVEAHHRINRAWQMERSHLA